MACNSRAKGARLEREARDRCKTYWFAENCVRNGQTSGKVCADIGNALPKTSVEVKGRAKHAAFRYIQQCAEDAPEGDMPVLLMREDGDTEWLVCFKMSQTDMFVARYIRAMALGVGQASVERFFEDSRYGV